MADPIVLLLRLSFFNQVSSTKQVVSLLRKTPGSETNSSAKVHGIVASDAKTSIGFLAKLLRVVKVCEFFKFKNCF